MARSIRIQAAGAFYHVLARGNRREDIFHDDDDRRFFLHTLSQACDMTGWRVQAWVLMDNHYHLFIQTPEPNLVSGMSWFQNTLTRRYNVRHRKWGRLFGDRYKAVIVQGEDRYHYQTLMDYIHLNPVRARLIQPKNGQSVMDYAWSSLASAYAVEPKRRAKWLELMMGSKLLNLRTRYLDAGRWLSGWISEPWKKRLKAVGCQHCQKRWILDAAICGVAGIGARRPLARKWAS